MRFGFGDPVYCVKDEQLAITNLFRYFGVELQRRKKLFALLLTSKVVPVLQCLGKICVFNCLAKEEKRFGQALNEILSDNSRSE